ncbi:MAG: TM0106 family RecB-like putative nuclease [Microthrixaceae bacterium]|nr:TM0106 family RecB-like putative nuclease [Acidimicrobiales bacterium]MCB9403187.1 TM0106 family RecB-like putative nuclease [Microthrixaceae bacterium]
MEYGTPTPHPGVELTDVPLQPAEVAMRCPVRADLDHAPSMAPRRRAPDPDQLHRAELTAAHAERVGVELADRVNRSGGRAVVIQGQREEATAATLAAIASDATVIIGAALPDDPGGRRLGRTTLLVRRNPGADRSTWVPVEIRRHAFVRPATGGTLLTSDLDEPHPSSAVTVEGMSPRNNRHNENGIALAHSWRLLEAVGAVSQAERPVGGVIDGDGQLWWLALDEPRWPNRWASGLVSTLAHYDHGFGFRLEVIANRLARDADPDVPRGVVPVHIGQCATCPWDPVCRAEMEALDHISLIPRSTYDHVLVHRDRSVTTRAQVAALDWNTAWLMFGDSPRDPVVDAADLLERTEGLPGETDLAALLLPTVQSPPSDFDQFIWSSPITSPELHLDAQPGFLHLEPVRHRAVQLSLDLDGDLDLEADLETEPEGEHLAPDLDADPMGPPDPPTPDRSMSVLVDRLATLGMTTVGDLAQLDPFTAGYSNTLCGHLPTVIDQARASNGGGPFLARGLLRPKVRLADVEVDVDMENIDDGVYLWGTLVSGTAPALDQVGVEAGYRPFFSWDPVDAGVQLDVFDRFWAWLSDLRHRCRSLGLSFAAYCYTSAEHNKMVQILDEAPRPVPGRREAIEDLVASPDWVDMYQVVRASLVVGHGFGLKKIAPLAGFGWRDPDAGGLQSMNWYREAVNNPSPEARSHNRGRLLQYNEDDVRATHAVRHWLATAEIPSIGSWVAP